MQLTTALSAKQTFKQVAANDRFEPFPTDAAFVTNGQNADLTDLRCGHEKSEFAETKAVKMGGKQAFAALCANDRIAYKFAVGSMVADDRSQANADVRYQALENSITQRKVQLQSLYRKWQPAMQVVG